MMVFALGARHGLDLDHIATIDAITRAMRKNNHFARMAGLFFSLGHGFVVIGISLIVGSGFAKEIFPAALEPLGQGISIFFLLAFGLFTLWNVLQTKSHRQSSSPVSILLAKYLPKRLNPLAVILIGTLFALSFDTITQVAFFSLSASLLAGWSFSLLLGAAFTAGMMMADGLNGFFMSKLIQKADSRSVTASQFLGLIIAVFSLALGIYEFYELILSALNP